MTDDVCITNDELWARVHPVDRPRPCRRRGQHYAACDSDECRGCVPRGTVAGYLCPVCWEKVNDALGRVGDLIMHLRSVEKPAQALGERVATSMERSILMPDTWIAADALLDALGAQPVRAALDVRHDFPELQAHVAGALAPWADVEAAVSTREGAKRAVVLIGRMRTALKRWPDSEATWRHVPHMLCPKGGAECGQSLYRRAPLEYGDDLLIECVQEACDYARDYFEWVDAYEVVLMGVFQAQDKADGTKRARRFASTRPRQKPTSDECDADTHPACLSLSCTCDCHYRRYSLFSPGVAVARKRREEARRA